MSEHNQEFNVAELDAKLDLVVALASYLKTKLLPAFGSGEELAEVVLLAAVRPLGKAYQTLTTEYGMSDETARVALQLTISQIVSGVQASLAA